MLVFDFLGFGCSFLGLALVGCLRWVLLGVWDLRGLCYEFGCEFLVTGCEFCVVAVLGSSYRVALCVCVVACS